ncbi:MAG: exo-alpha-sialidase [Candidatus Aminicenantes bacterium]|nr:exo-alpha-sialidase [Candidatus Aminicenantes bacterium]
MRIKFRSINVVRLGIFGGLIFLWLLYIAGNAIGQAKEKIIVGKNVHVSKMRNNIEHGEVILASDPYNPNNLIGASMMISNKKNKFITVVYASFDGGKTWEPTLETENFTLSGDPSISYGPDGKVYYVCMASKTPHSVLDFLKVYTSNDKGKTWQFPVSIPNTSFDYLDRPFIAVDNTSGIYNGRIYIHALGTTRGLDGLETAGSINLYRSYDEGKNFNGPVKRISFGERYPFAPGNSVVLSDGTLVIIFPEIKNIGKKNGPLKIDPSKPYESNAWLKVIMSKDGGESLTEAVTIDDFYLDWRGGAAGANSFLPSLAVDPGSLYFKDRLYAVWPDNRSGRLEILFSYSADKGKTWSIPKVISENRAFDYNDPSKGPNNFSPVVAVNKDGVVGVMWYDRRDNPDNLSYWVRFTASLDGGDTFLPSVRVSEFPHERGKNDKWTLLEMSGSGTRQGVLSFRLSLNMFYFSGGHTAGMAADANGVFHPFWVDTRTGMGQVWTAPVKVNGTAIPHGSVELAKMDNIADKVMLELSNITIDRTSGRVSVDARLKNISDKTIYGPVKVRVIKLDSSLGHLRIENADNGKKGIGGIWDFTPFLINNQIKPNESSKVKKLVFRLSDVLPVWQNKLLKYNAVWVETRVLGKVKK